MPVSIDVSSRGTSHATKGFPAKHLASRHALQLLLHVNIRASDSRTLSVCIPVHEGRAPLLDELLLRLTMEPRFREVQVCISDNASSDCANVVERHREALGDQLRYARNDRNEGFAENLFGAVELASSEYCWLMGSDDAPAPGALRSVLELIEGHKGTSGLHLGHLRVSAADLTVPGCQVAPEAYPPQRTTTRLRGMRDLTESSGYLFLFLSNNVVRRDLWQGIVDSEREVAAGYPFFPHTYVMSRFAASAPDWVWCPHLLILSRSAALCLEEVGLSGARQVRALLSELDRLWARLHGRFSYLHRALMHKALRQLWTREQILACRLAARGWREDLANLGTVRHFWWSRDFWRHSAQALVLPMGPLEQPPRGHTDRYSTVRLLDPEQRRTTLRGRLPAALTIGYSQWVDVIVENHGTADLSSAGPYPIMLAARWEDPRTGAPIYMNPVPAHLWPRLASGRRQRVQLLLNPPLTPGHYRLSVALTQASVCWFDEHDDRNGLRRDVIVRAVDDARPVDLELRTPVVSGESFRPDFALDSPP